jgi:diacylglycerol kinase family enzyme
MEVDANAMGGFLVVNPRSARGHDAESLAREAERLGIETRILGPGERPGEVAPEAPEGPIGAAGGDGSLAAVAEAALEQDRPFVVVPVGRFNHLARDLGLDRGDPFAALRAFAGRETRIDVARVNGRLFLNNVSLGLYARLVHEEGGGDTFARLTALGLLLRHPSGLGVTSDGRPLHARVVVVSNNHYSLDVFSAGERERLDEGSLYLYVAHGWLPKTWEERAGTAFTLDARAGHLRAAIDGEPEVLETPLSFEIEPAALRVLLPDEGQYLARVRERELVVRDLGGREPAELGDVVVRLGRALDDASRPVEVERHGRRAVAAVAVHPDSEELERLDLDSRLLAQLAAHAVPRMLLLVEKPARKIPLAGERVDAAPREQNAPVAVETDRARGRLRARVHAEAALGALDHPPAGLGLCAAARTVLPLIELAHVPQQ